MNSGHTFRSALRLRMGKEFNDSKQSWQIVAKKESLSKRTTESFLNCGGAWLTTKTMEEVRKEREEDKLHQLLMGLDETLYGGVKSSLLS